MESDGILKSWKWLRNKNPIAGEAPGTEIEIRFFVIFDNWLVAV
jgi:hypothetical protein